jgi:hypothetical protein
MSYSLSWTSCYCLQRCGDNLFRTNRCATFTFLPMFITHTSPLFWLFNNPVYHISGRYNTNRKLLKILAIHSNTRPTRRVKGFNKHFVIRRMRQHLSSGFLFFFWTFPSSGILETRKLVQWLRLALSKWPNWVGVLFPPFYMRTETDPVSETSCFLVSRIPDDGKVQKKNRNPVCYTPSSEPFRIHLSSALPMTENRLLKCVERSLKVSTIALNNKEFIQILKC